MGAPEQAHPYRLAGGQAGSFLLNLNYLMNSMRFDCSKFADFNL
jgi:hypothetical protein